MLDRDALDGPAPRLRPSSSESEESLLLSSLDDSPNARGLWKMQHSERTTRNQGA